MAKKMKLPNGYGSIVKLSGNRRNPYAVYPPVKEFNTNGSPIRPKAIGYYPTYTKAMEALTEFNKRPFNTDLRGLTYAQVYELWSKEKYAEVGLSEHSIKSYRNAFKRTSELFERIYSELRKEDFQKILDNSSSKVGTLRHYKNLWRQMGKYAIENDIVVKDYSEFAKINRENDVKMGTPYTLEDISRLWASKDDFRASVLLIMIYSGLRISELKSVNIDLEEQIFRGGIKTTAGKNRIVPIHPRIKELVEKFDQDKLNVNSFLQSAKIFMGKAGIDKSHTAHDARHTFSWLCDKYKVDDFSKHLMMGHSLGADVEKSTYGHRTVEELREEIEKICC